MGFGAYGFAPPAFLRDADAVLTGDGSITGDDLVEELVEGHFGTLADLRIIVRRF